MTKLVLLLSALLPGAAFVACATDNGDAVHGPQFGPPPERPDGATDGPIVGEEGGPPPGDGGREADAPASCAAGTVVVLAGDDVSLSGAAQIAGGAWKGAAIAGGAARSHPAIVPLGSGFVALTRGPGDALQSMTFGTSWSAAVAVGAATTIGAPALAVVGTKAQAVYIAPSNLFFRAENAGTSWGVTADPVTAGAVQSFGPSAGSLAASGAEVVFAQDGNDEGLYTQKYDGAWSVGVAIVGASTLTSAPPALQTIDGKFDVVLLYAEKAAPHVINFATRDAITKGWSAAAVTQATAQTADQPQIARISTSKLIATFRGNDQRPYWMSGAIGASAITWSTPVPLLADTSTVGGPPAVARGVCGDDAIAVFASGGQVKATRYRGTSWSPPEAVAFASGTRVSVATR